MVIFLKRNNCMIIFYKACFVMWNVNYRANIFNLCGHFLKRNYFIIICYKAYFIIWNVNCIELSQRDLHADTDWLATVAALKAPPVQPVATTPPSTRRQRPSIIPHSKSQS